MTVLHWPFPINRPHAGVPLADGTMGLMVWGTNTLNITIGRAGFWDHRGGSAFATKTTYRELEALLQANDQAGLDAIFGAADGIFGADRPHQVSGGRLVVTPPAGWTLTQASLDCERGVVAVTARGPQANEVTLQLRQVIGCETAELRVPVEWRAAVHLVPAWDVIRDDLAALGMAEPIRGQDVAQQWFEQTLPADEPLALALVEHEHGLRFATALGADALKLARQRAAQPCDWSATEAWWHDYWHSVPKMAFSDPVVQEIVDMGLYRQACATPEHGVACTLQGPFLEDYQLPPWSCDYHFNINAEMVYWPALASGRWQHFQPLWQLLASWREQLQQNAADFFGEPDAMMLPHAVDDRCQAVGSFWAGAIDHGCTAWMAQMAWLHYRYSGEEAVLRETAWPLLTGAFAGYWAMLRRESLADGGERFALPVSVSPEFRGARLDAWGRNASFQLAAVHMLCRILPQAAEQLGQPIDPRWRQVAKGLPAYTTITTAASVDDARQVTRIALWQDMDLIESHRHHSHLAALYPFATIDLDSNQGRDAALIRETLSHWIATGAGRWSGWCVPWAATLLARVNEAGVRLHGCTPGASGLLMRAVARCTMLVIKACRCWPVAKIRTVNTRPKLCSLMPVWGH